MRKTVLLFILIILSISLFAKQDVKNEKIAYLPISSHDINVFVTALDGNENFYFSDIIYIKKSDVPFALKFAFNLCKDYQLEEVLVDDLAALVIGVNQYSIDYFKGKIDNAQFELIGTNANIYEVELPSMRDHADDIKIEIKYFLKKNHKSISFKHEDNSFNIDGNKFWYPQNIIKNANSIKVSVNTLEKYKVSAGNEEITTKTEEGILESSFDVSDTSLPINIKILKR